MFSGSALFPKICILMHSLSKFMRSRTSFSLLEGKMLTL
ncbi:hypothetical protein Gotur_020403 [Gossypium turneri]